MKTSRLLLLAGLLAGSVSFALAGPGPQFWAQRAADQKAAASTATATIAAPAASVSHTAAATASCTTCACCKKG